MKYLAVDYGKKNIGLAISDSAGTVAMPFGVFENNDNFPEIFKKILSENAIDEIVIGESKNLKGERNLIQDKIDLFTDFINELGVKNHSVSEIMTSMESKWGIEKDIRRTAKNSRKQQKNTRVDDKAATMILKTFLESNKN